MKIKIHGAAGGEVTGSSYLVQTDQANILIDCGMFQGGKASEAKNKLPQGAKVQDIDAVLLTHGHLDHTGRVPLLVKFGFDGPIYSTRETLELAQIILQDSARLQVGDAVRKNRKFWKKGMPPFEVLYTTEHVELMRELTRPIKTNTPIAVADGITATWIEAGHMLGSGSIKLEVIEKGKKKTVVFSGDLGPVTMPLLKPFDHFNQAELVFLEGTYGDRDHKPYDQTLEEFEAIIKETCASGGKMLVPTFAIGRAQQIIYHLADLFHSGKIPKFPVYLDSPMALSAFNVYRNHQDLLDEEFHALKRKGVFPLDEQYFIPSQSADSSKALNTVKGPCMILAGAGMCNGGRILHHLAHNISNPNTHVIIVGYQSHGSIGRRLVEKATKISLFGEEKVVRAQVHTLNGFSAHAGQTDLMKWFSYLAPSKPKVVITHGEDIPRKALAACIKKQHKIIATIPKIGDVIEL
ncbi:MAG TPA: MBL fold metallo-hydrolase [Chryseolinea sp.]|nr:MBL fold metallo-hydrolase [Chryseolinea sp.]HPM29094.1 MBL fold metallo-hydrolase [Chryseolinea sp.]